MKKNIFDQTNVTDVEGEFWSTDIKLENGEMEILETVTQDGHRKRKASGEHSDAPIAKRPKIMIHQDVYAKRMEDIIIKTHKVKTLSRKTRHNDLRYFVKHWRYNLPETTSFLQYYEENNNLVDECVLDKNACIENLYTRYTEFYGLNESYLCKECSYDEGGTIYHA
jgi:hypothetical protein